MRILLFFTLLLALSASAKASPDWPDATPTAWHQLARAESLLTSPEPPNPVAVCVVDSGVNLTPDLAPAVIERLAYDGGDPGDTYPQDGIDDGHGTYVATFLAGQVNGWGGAGLWPRAKIVSVRVFPPGGVRAQAAAYIRGLKACAQRSDVRVVNLSLGDVDGTAAEIAELENRIRDLREENDINVVAAAGNRGGQVEVPARFSSAFAVGGVSESGAICAFSARGHELDVLAPGCELFGADLKGTNAVFAGTSFAAPIVSAALAALRSYRHLSADDAERLLIDRAHASPDGPIIDVRAALLPEWSAEPMLQREAQETAMHGGQSHESIFLDYPRPSFRLQRQAGLRRAYLRIHNRPKASAVLLRCGTRDWEVARDLIRLPRTRRRIQIRFISDRGASPWAVVKPRR